MVSLEGIEEGFDVVDYPPELYTITVDELTNVIASPQEPLNLENFNSYLDADGRLLNEHKFRQSVFRGGVDKNIRKDVWKFLFNVHPFHSTAREREVLALENYMKYRALRRKWQKCIYEDGDTSLLSPNYTRLNGNDYLKRNSNGETSKDVTNASSHVMDMDNANVFNNNLLLLKDASPHMKQQLDFMQLQTETHAERYVLDMTKFKNSIYSIDKDVPRTDRDNDYNGSHNLIALRNILITFAAFNEELGYVQGMNDLASLFLEIFGNEVDAYWPFSIYMETVEKDFSEDGLIDKLKVLQDLLNEIDGDLWRYLDQLGVGDMAFCHRWILLSFKREFSKAQALKCFEILASHHLELSSMEANIARSKEIRKETKTSGGGRKSSNIDINGDYTFSVFMCVTLLITNRAEIFQCKDVSEVIELISRLTKNLRLEKLLAMAEVLFFKYCRKSVIDCFEIIEAPSSAYNFISESFLS